MTVFRGPSPKLEAIIEKSLKSVFSQIELHTEPEVSIVKQWPKEYITLQFSNPIYYSARILNVLACKID